YMKKFVKFKVFLAAVLLVSIFSSTRTAFADEYFAKDNQTTVSFTLSNVQNNIWSENALNSVKATSYYKSINSGINGNGINAFRGTGGGVGGAGLGILAFSSHSKNACKLTHDKHTKRRPGGNE
ncbi:hypothetical protein L2022_10360, partial [Lactobacillus gasseri]|nr:hypothetical protein [Lactobacillus gasseri]